MALKFVAGLLFLFSAYFYWFAIENSAFVWMDLAALPMLCGIGLVLGRRWASYLWYSMAAGVGAWWLVTIAGMALRGWPASDVTETVVSLIPGLLLLAVAIGGSVAVRKAYLRSVP